MQLLRHPEKESERGIEKAGGRDSAREAGRESECEREGGSTMRPLVICTCVALVVLVRLTMFSVFLAVLFTVLYFCVFILFYFVFCLLALVSLLTEHFNLRASAGSRLGYKTF